MPATDSIRSTPLFARTYTGLLAQVHRHYRPGLAPLQETGLVVLVPQFISSGDWIRVNTANGEYTERV